MPAREPNGWLTAQSPSRGACTEAWQEAQRPEPCWSCARLAEPPHGGWAKTQFEVRMDGWLARTYGCYSVGRHQTDTAGDTSGTAFI